MLYYAEIEEFDKLPDSEIAEIGFFEELPENLTYPGIHIPLINYIKMER